MNGRAQWAMVWGMILVFVTLVVFLPGLVRAGELEPTAPPGSTMHTLDEIYQKLEELVPGGLVPLAKTGQTTSYAAGDDGDLQKGAAWPVPRFTDHRDGTVTDNRTGLMWTENADMDGPKTWSDAFSGCDSCRYCQKFHEKRYVSMNTPSDWRLRSILGKQ